MGEKNNELKAKVVEVQKTEHILLRNVGSKKDGSPKKAKGSKVKLTEKQVIIYKSQKLI